MVKTQDRGLTVFQLNDSGPELFASVPPLLDPFQPHLLNPAAALASVTPSKSRKNSVVKKTKQEEDKKADEQNGKNTIKVIVSGAGSGDTPCPPKKKTDNDSTTTQSAGTETATVTATPKAPLTTTPGCG